MHYDSVAASVQRVTGFEITLAGVLLHGSTDTAILREACRQAGIPAKVLEEQYDAILEAMRNSVAERRHELDPELMPGVEEVLRHLAQKGALLGVASGNLEAIGWIKIEKAGLREWFRFGGFSDHFPVRPELDRAGCAEGARAGRKQRCEICVVGDTPRDIEAARANFLSVIAVATGKYSFDELLTVPARGLRVLAGGFARHGSEHSMRTREAKIAVWQRTRKRLGTRSGRAGAVARLCGAGLLLAAIPYGLMAQVTSATAGADVRAKSPHDSRTGVRRHKLS